MLKRIRVVGVTVALAAGLVGAVGPTASAATTTKIGYTCRSGADTTAIGVAVSATFPDRFAAGRAFRPTDVATTVSIPREALTGIGDATSVTATTQLTVKVAQGGQSADATWFGDAPGTTIPAGGDLKLTATGDVPTVTVHGSDPVSFTAAGLDVTLTPADTAKVVSLSCTPGSGQRTILARLTTIGAGRPSASPTGSPAATSPPSRNIHGGGITPSASPGIATPDTRSSPATPEASDVPPGANGDEINPVAYRTCRDFDYQNQLLAESTYAAGLATVSKLNAAAVVGYPETALLRSRPGEGLYSTATTNVGDDRWWCSKLTVSLDHGGRREFPVSTSTSAAFGFVPVTANAHLSQVGDAPVTAVVYAYYGPASGALLAGIYPLNVVATAQISLRLSDVRINGVPLDVGPNCRTSGPLYTHNAQLDPDNNQVVMTGGTSTTATTPIFGNPIGGGGTGGDVTIPPFSGCVTPSGDSLNKLLTATVSGSGNYSKLTTGPLCPGFDLAGTCDKANLIPGTFATWTLTHGGPFSASLTSGTDLQMALQPTGGSGLLSCTSARLSGTSYNHIGPTRGYLGYFAFSDIGGCTDNTGGTWTVQPQSRVNFSPVVAFGGLPGDPLLRMRGTGAFTLRRTAGGQACTLTFSGAVGMTYSNKTGQLNMATAQSVQAGADMIATASTCPEYPVHEPVGGSIRATRVQLRAGQFTLPPGQAFTLTNP